MSRTAKQTKPGRSGQTREQRHIAWYVLGGTALAALYLAGHGLLPQDMRERTTSTIPAGQPVSYRAVPALLARARVHDPLLRLPHARWFIRVRHGRAQFVVVDHAPLQTGGGSPIGAGGGR